MTRSPLAAWRRLYMIGGAPAASHASLTRAPDSERMLNPAAGWRVAGDASFSALIKPLDISQALARATGLPQSGVERPTEAGEPERRERVRGNSRAPDASPEATSSRRRGTEPVGSDRLKHPARTTSERASRAELRHPKPALPENARARIGSLLDALNAKEHYAGKLPSGRARPNDIVRSRSTSGTGARNSGVGEANSRIRSPGALPRPASALSATARSAANTPITASAPTAALVRLLQATVGNSAKAAGTATSPEAGPISAKLASNPNVQLEDLLERAQARRSQGPLGSDPEGTGSGRPRPWSDPALSAMGATPGSARLLEIGTEEIPAGGFRGLAARTLRRDEAGASRPASRTLEHHAAAAEQELSSRPRVLLEAEQRVAASLLHDTLDERVADSLARVLEREARRHGIDLAEARA